jgi:hypothetical protein
VLERRGSDHAVQQRQPVSLLFQIYSETGTCYFSLLHGILLDKSGAVPRTARTSVGETRYHLTLLSRA